MGLCLGMLLFPFIKTVLVVEGAPHSTLKLHFRPVVLLSLHVRSTGVCFLELTIQTNVLLNLFVLFGRD
jgi:hypothetical protein